MGGKPKKTTGGGPLPAPAAKGGKANTNLPFQSVLPSPPKSPCTAEQILFGPPVDPVLRITGYSDEEFENFIREWAYYSQQLQERRYVQVGRFGGAGDMGRDVVGYIDPPSSGGRLDIFQCKHYDHGLHPGDVWVELGKLCYFTFQGAFAVPERYCFVAPKDTGPELGRLLEHPDELKDKLIEAWEASVAGKIVARKTIALEGKLLSYVESFDFKRVSCKPIHEILEEHKRTSRHAPRFGGGLTRPCPPDPAPPAAIETHEQRYVEQLLEAYQDHASDQTITTARLKNHAQFGRHFHRSRERYFCAETLRQFARDNLPDGSTFDEVQDQVYDTVIDIVERDHPSGLRRLEAATDKASVYTVTNHPLRVYLKSKSLMGICHQLANADRLNWVRK